MAETSAAQPHHDDLFSSVISDIRTYASDDPLLPWLRGIRRMKERLPPHVLEEKLPRFLQKCAEKFQSDRRYRNDLRYLRVWLHLVLFGIFAGYRGVIATEFVDLSKFKARDCQAVLC